MSKTFSESLLSSTLVFDGGMGTEIYRRHVFTNQSYDGLNLHNRKLIAEITQSYFDAGADVLTTNTYGANRFALERYGVGEQVEEINRNGVEIARDVAFSNSTEGRQAFVAGSVGYPAQEVFEKRERSEIVDCFSEQIAALVKAGVDFVLFESQPSRESGELMIEALGAVD
ncbi:MAG: homocysteine S-methyltransferase family protein, partial [Thermoguttaceae bacterium]|nr:homocysteine S-methyltransferase family protein [Thermoguttaceae bacterium]